jgi:hypothetical protein
LLPLFFDSVRRFRTKQLAPNPVDNDPNVFTVPIKRYGADQNSVYDVAVPCEDGDDTGIVHSSGQLCRPEEWVTRSKYDFTVRFVWDFANFVAISLVGERGGILVKILAGWKEEDVTWPSRWWARRRCSLGIDLIKIHQEVKAKDSFDARRPSCFVILCPG